MGQNIKILVINPGSTSTKVAVFSGAEQLFEQTIRHNAAELAACGDRVFDQYPFRRDLILDIVKSSGVGISDLDVVIGRGGLLRPIASGVYEVSESMIDDLREGARGEHASNLGGVIASDIAKLAGCKAYIADPVVVDEMSDVARIGGHPLFPRKSIFHALNHKAVAKEYAHKIEREYEDLNLIVVHMGGGVSVGAHLAGRVVDVNNALDGEGVFSPERSGTVSAGDLLKVCESHNYSTEQMHQMLVGRGGFASHLGTTDTKQIVENAEAGDEKSALIIDAFCYGVAKQVAAMTIPLSSKVDAIILTGGIAYSRYICERIISHIAPIAKVEIVAGEDEMSSLAANGREAYLNSEIVKKY